jgi:hypothetical protein
MLMAGDGRGEIDLARFESLGDNCEFGFVLRALGNHQGGLFRWARADADQVVAALETGLSDLYMTPSPRVGEPGMVNDARYGIGWHSNGDYRAERSMIEHLRLRFLDKLQSGRAIFVYKAHGLQQQRLSGQLDAALRALAGEMPYTLLTVATGNRPGTVIRSAPGQLLGFVGRFAPYGNAYDAQMSEWNLVLERAAAMT